MIVRENVAYGLMVKGVGKAERRAQAPRGTGHGAARGLRRPAPRPALRRAAAAGRAGPGAGQPPQGAAARRAARSARPQAARADAGRAQGDPARGRHHLPVRHPRPGGGADDERPRSRSSTRAGSSRSARRARSTSSRRPPFVAGFVGTSNLHRRRRRAQPCSARTAPSASGRRRSRVHLGARRVARRPARSSPTARSHEVVYAGAVDARRRQAGRRARQLVARLAAEHRTATSGRAAARRLRGQHDVRLGSARRERCYRVDGARTREEGKSMTRNKLLALAAAALSRSLRAAGTTADSATGGDGGGDGGGRQQGFTPPDLKALDRARRAGGRGQHRRLGRLRRGRLAPTPASTG